MKENKTVIHPNLFNLLNIIYVAFGVFGIFIFALIIFTKCIGSGVFSENDSRPEFLCILFIASIVFVSIPLGKKITICDDVVDYRNWFFKHSKIRVTSETKIKMGLCYPIWGGHPDFIWKISNNRGKEKIKIDAWYFNYKKVNEELSKLTGYKIDYSLAEIKF